MRTACKVESRRHNSCTSSTQTNAKHRVDTTQCFTNWMLPAYRDPLHKIVTMCMLAKSVLNANKIVAIMPAIWLAIEKIPATVMR